MRSHRLALPATAAALSLPLLLFVRGYPWSMAIVVAVAVGALAYALRRTVEQVRLAIRAHRVDPPPSED